MAATLASDATVIQLFAVSPLADCVPLILQQDPAPDLAPEEIAVLRDAIQLCGAHLRGHNERPEWPNILAALIVAYRGCGSGEFDRALFEIDLTPPDDSSPAS
jgi:hypothetical protein